MNRAYGSLFSTGKDERSGSIRARKLDGSVTLAYNGFNATGNRGPSAGWNGSGYSGILYIDFLHNYRLMFDWVIRILISNRTKPLLYLISTLKYTHQSELNSYNKG
ncbi:MAG: hypothetical protein K8S15_10220 [Candidatus Aegiribacteria sp.]|nr:hypothetical protein [Candidatus Aegiribacteria sp.]